MIAGHENQGPIVVVKLGGSLLSLPDLAGRLGAMIHGLRDARLLIVCGGGEAADIVRCWQTIHNLTDEQAHWLAFRAVSLNESLLCRLLPDAVVTSSRDEMQAAWCAGRLPILTAEPFTRTEEPRASQRLPHDWTVTSDSIAAWVTRRLGARRVVLCKSCDAAPGITLKKAAAQELIDAHFPVCAAGLAIDWVNLRADEPRLLRWQSAPEPHPAESEGLA